MGPFVVNIKEDIGDAHRDPASYHREEIEAFMRWYMGDAGGRRNKRGSGKPVG